MSACTGCLHLHSSNAQRGQYLYNSLKFSIIVNLSTVVVQDKHTARVHGKGRQCLMNTHEKMEQVSIDDATELRGAFLTQPDRRIDPLGDAVLKTAQSQ